MGKLCEFLALNIVDINNSFIYNIKLDVNIDNECYIGIKAKASALQQHNSNALCMLNTGPVMPCTSEYHDAGK
jgi:hypothetical protein